jgi:hypothetical protein
MSIHMVLSLGLTSCLAPGGDVLQLTGPYLGQKLPGETPELFAPGIVSTGMYTRDIAITPDGKEIYFGLVVGPWATILETHLTPRGWTRPEVAPFARDARFFNLEPAISPDGKRFFFLSTRVPGPRSPEPGEIRAWVNQDIWVMDRVGDGWGEPYNLGAPVNSADAEFFPSLGRDGTLYFTRSPAGGGESYIYRSKLVDGRYQEPEKLPAQVNSTPSQYNAFVAPDQRFLVFSTQDRKDGRGSADYYISFRGPDDTWTGPVNLGDVVNSPMGAEFSPYVSPDGRFFFFMAVKPRPQSEIPDSLTLGFLKRYRAEPGSGNPAVYWMDASFLDRLKPRTGN